LPAITVTNKVIGDLLALGVNWPPVTVASGEGPLGWHHLGGDGQAGVDEPG
jgi:hypothetical protein